MAGEREFAELFEKETGLKPEIDFKVGSTASGEPRVAELNRPLVGLALSGGGIRSAIFNLGVMQRLAKLGILDRIHYLATVSGGGYIGGFWSAWIHHQKLQKAKNPEYKEQIFPLPSKERKEPDRIRELREFASYLSPRFGVLHGDGLRILLHTIAMVSASLGFVCTFLLLVVTCLIVSDELPSFVLTHAEIPKSSGFERLQPFLNGVTRSHLLLWFHGHPFLWLFTPALLTAGGLWLIGVINVIFTGFFCRELGSNRIPSVAHQIARFTFWIVVITLGYLLGLWTSVASLSRSVWPILLGQISSLTGIVSGFLAARQWLLRKVILQREPNARQLDGKLARLITRFIPPAFIFLLIALLTFVAEKLSSAGLSVPFSNSTTVQVSEGPLLFWTGAAFFGFLLLFRPGIFSMRELFRARISRAFLASANPFGTSKRKTRIKEIPRVDDVLLAGLQGQDGTGGSPLHLICCAANDLAGDTLENLNDGARSAVLSKHGIWADHCWRTWSTCENMHLSAALATSAAAFNTQMGHYTVYLGRSLAFVIAALNLRLGLWVKHPAHQFSRIEKSVGFGRNCTVHMTFPGLLFLRELFSYTRLLGAGWAKERHRCRNMLRSLAKKRRKLRSSTSKNEDDWKRRVRTLAANRRDIRARSERKTRSQYIHLSDGGHFENFGLYELVRRHVPYIILSEAGTDPRNATKDLGNTISKIRADFGIEIDLDVSEMKPGEDGFFKQHVAVGTIDYSERYQGVVIYIRTGLTGDEPVDVLQYRHANPSFPHESTTDQFFTSAQWEAYRRLGDHVADEVFAVFKEARFEDSGGGSGRDFSSAFWMWKSLPENVLSRIGRINERHHQFMQEMMCEESASLIHSIYPEWKLLAVKPPGHPVIRKPQAVNLSDLRNEAFREGNRLLAFKWARMATLYFEEVWRELDIERYYEYPEIKPWLNLLDRWSDCFEVQICWPVLTTLVDPYFVAFVERNSGHKLSNSWTIRLNPSEVGEGFEGEIKFSIRVNNPDIVEWCVGSIKKVKLLCSDDRKCLIARWDFDSFHIEQSYRGIGLGRRCLLELMKCLHRTARNIESVERLTVEVNVADPDGFSHPWPKSERIRFYHEEGFYPVVAGSNLKSEEWVRFEASGFVDTLRVEAGNSAGEKQRLLFVLTPPDAERTRRPPRTVGELRYSRNASKSGTVRITWQFLDFEVYPPFWGHGHGFRCIEAAKNYFEEERQQSGTHDRVLLEVDIHGRDPKYSPWPPANREEFYRDLGFVPELIDAREAGSKNLWAHIDPAALEEALMARPELVGDSYRYHFHLQSPDRFPISVGVLSNLNPVRKCDYLGVAWTDTALEVEPEYACYALQGVIQSLMRTVLEQKLRRLRIMVSLDPQASGKWSRESLLRVYRYLGFVPQPTPNTLVYCQDVEAPLTALDSPPATGSEMPPATE